MKPTRETTEENEEDKLDYLIKTRGFCSGCKEAEAEMQFSGKEFGHLRVMGKSLSL